MLHHFLYKIFSGRLPAGTTTDYKFMNMLKQLRKSTLPLAALALLAVSCKDDYYYDDREPDWLGESIYQTLVDRGDFTYFLRIIDSCDYRDVLNRTGSKTMFVCCDSSFENFFKDNEYGITRFEDFTQSQLNGIKEYAIINDANLIELLSFDEGYEPGQVMRRSTALDPLDMLSFEKGDQLPDNNSYFEPFREKGLWILNDNTSPRLVQFFEAQMAEKGITDSDFSYLFNGKTRQTGDAHLFDKKVVERDITCKNGYIHILDGLLMPQPNMAEFIRKDGEVTTFNRLLNRFSAPYGDVDNTRTYWELHPEFRDSIYVRHYFNSGISGQAATLETPDGRSLSEDELLIYDPGWNAYSYTDGKADMAAMFVPSDKAMAEYFSKDGDGSYLYERYKYWDSMPDDVAASFLNAHMKYSFLNSLPSKFDNMKNESGDLMYAKPTDIERAKVTSNGVVYVTKQVYPPVDYVSVMAPVLVSENTRVFNYALHKFVYDIYLRSMETVYSNYPAAGSVPPYSFIVPYDQSIDHYVYTASLGHEEPEMVAFGYDNAEGSAVMTRYEMDPSTGELLDNGTVLEKYSPSTGGSDIVNAYLNEMMDYHIVVGEIKPEQEYYQTKGKGFIRVKMLDNDNITFYGGGNMEMNQKGWSYDGHDYSCRMTRYLKFRNGKTYFIDKPMQQATTSVYSMLKSYPQFSTFASYANNVPSEFSDQAIFYRDSKYSGLDWNVKSFAYYHYTVYVPNNAAMKRAQEAGLPTWADVKATSDENLRKYKANKILNFLRYHFQDNAIFLKGEDVNDELYESASHNSFSQRFFQLKVSQSGNRLTVTPAVTNSRGKESFLRDPIVINGQEDDNTPVVLGDHNQAYNLMTRDYFFSGSDIKTVKGSSSDYSAWAVVHEIDDYLSFIEPPSLEFTNVQTDSAITYTQVKFDITDNGEGVAFNKSVITKKGFCYAWHEKPTVEDDYWLASTGKSDVGTFSKFFEYADLQGATETDSLLYVRGYAQSKWSELGHDTTLPEYQDETRMESYTPTQICINIKTGKALEL